MNWRKNPNEKQPAHSRMPRTRYSHLSDDEFYRLTEFEAASEELLEEYRARFRPSGGR